MNWHQELVVIQYYQLQCDLLCTIFVSNVYPQANRLAEGVGTSRDLVTFSFGQKI